MRALVTGGTGFLGGRLVAQLRAAGVEVTALVRDPARAGALAALGCTLATGDLAAPGCEEALDRALDGAEVCYHLAAWYEIGCTDADGMRRANVDGTERVLAAAGRAGTPKVVYCGTTAALGSHPPGAGGAPELPATGDGLGSCYARTKWEAHRRAREHAARGLPLAVVMPGSVYGPGDRSLIHSLIAAAASGAVVVDAFPTLELTLVHVDDVAACFPLAAAKGAVGGEYVASGDTVSVRDLLSLVARLAGHTPPRASLPPSLLRAFAPLFPMVAPLLGLPGGLADEALALVGLGSWSYGSERAERELGWRHRPLDEGMRETVAWARANPPWTRPRSPEPATGSRR